MPNPEPDQYGRYRVRRKGDKQSPSWSTRLYDPEKHVIVSGPASDSYGAAWPSKPHRRFSVTDTDESFPQPHTEPNPNPDEEIA